MAPDKSRLRRSISKWADTADQDARDPREVLTEEQRRLYHEARWSAHRPMGPHGGGSPGAGAPMK